MKYQILAVKNEYKKIIWDTVLPFEISDPEVVATLSYKEDAEKICEKLNQYVGQSIVEKEGCRYYKFQVKEVE